MAIATLQSILDRLDSWPEARREAAAELLASLEARDTDDLQVSDADLAEIERRLAEPDAPSMTFEEFRHELRDLLK
jgi:hypothetical protein